MKRPDILDYPSSQRDKYFDDLEAYCNHLEARLGYASQPAVQADAYCRCKYPYPPTTNKFEGVVCDACGKKRTA